MSKKSENYIFVSDLQCPFQAKKALEFIQYLKKTFNVTNENMYCVGDETDGYFGSLYKKHPDMHLSPTGEIKQTLDELKRWYSAFPKMKVAISNHGLRWVSKIIDADIPSQLLRPYREIIQAPDGWQWKQEWIIEGSKEKFRMIHGLGYSGDRGHVTAALDSGLSTVIGHLHAFGGVNHIRMISGVRLWAANAGCLIDTDSLAFAYGKYHRRQPTLGALVVLNGGSFPTFVPYDL